MPEKEGVDEMMEDSMMHVVVVTGMSGSGKSVVMDVLEDIGYYCIDNLPPQLIGKFVDICRESENHLQKLAIAADLRSGDMFTDAYQVLLEMERQSGLELKILYIEADDEVIIKRYKGRNKSSYDYVLDYVTSTLNHYGETCDNPLQKYILDKYSGRETKPFALQRLLNNEQLRNIFETALMHRDSFNEAFMGIWYNSQDIDEHLIIEKFLLNGVFNGEKCKIYIYKLVASSHCSLCKSMLFADTNWKSIRAGQPYCLIDSTNGYHLIYKKPNGISLYMTIKGSMLDIHTGKYNRIDVDIMIKDCKKKDS